MIKGPNLRNSACMWKLAINWIGYHLLYPIWVRYVTWAGWYLDGGVRASPLLAAACGEQAIVFFLPLVNSPIDLRDESHLSKLRDARTSHSFGRDRAVAGGWMDWLPPFRTRIYGLNTTIYGLIQRLLSLPVKYMGRARELITYPLALHPFILGDGVKTL